MGRATRGAGIDLGAILIYLANVVSPYKSSVTSALDDKLQACFITQQTNSIRLLVVNVQWYKFAHKHYLIAYHFLTLNLPNYRYT